MPSPSPEKPLPEALLRAEALPTLPAVALEILRITRDEESTMDDLAAALSRDPALAAKLLKLANSSLFNPGSPVTTLERATMLLGMKTVKLMALSFSLASTLPKVGNEAGFSLQDYWKRSLVNAVASRSLAERVRPRLCDEAFLCGLLGHLGRLVLARCMPEEYAPVVAEAGGWPSAELEEHHLGFHHADVTATLLRSWELPAKIHAPILHRADKGSLDDTEPETRTLHGILDTALQVEELVCGPNARRALRELSSGARDRFGLSEDEVDRFVVQLEEGIEKTAEMLNIELPSGMGLEDLVDQARLRIVDVSMGMDVELRQATRRNEELLSQASRDELTGLANRKRFDEFLAQQFARLQEPGSGSGPRRALGLILIDVDHFKRFNDTWGHAAGDEVLRMVGGVLARETRKSDVAARYGGEEFAVVLPNATNWFGLHSTAERLRRAIEESSLTVDGDELSVTASFGSACLRAGDLPLDPMDLVKLADHYLYEAKKNGRNRCETHRGMQLPG